MSDDANHVDPTRLDAYARGELPPADAKAVERHVAGCGECRDRLTHGLGGAGGDGAADERLEPPSMEVPETAQVRAVPSQVSVMYVPHTLDGDGKPSHTSVTTGIGPSHRREARPRRRVRHLGKAAAGLLVLALLLVVVVAAYLVGIRPHARSTQLTRRAQNTLVPVLEASRLPELQHPALRGVRVYRPGDDPQLEATLTEAEDALQQAVDANGDNVDARRMLALAHLMHGEPRIARTQLLEVEATLGPGPETQLGLGILDYLAAEVANDPEDRAYALAQADGHFQEVTLGAPGYPAALYNRALVALSRQDPGEARRLLGVYAELQPGSPWTAELQGRIEAASEPD